MRSSLLAALLVAAIVFAAVVGLQESRLLQGPELLVYDQWRRHALPEPDRSDRVVVVRITERDIRELGHWPLSDRTMAEMLRALIGAGASVVGLDVYRDLPVPPGERMLRDLLEREERIVAVSKFGALDSDGIPGPEVLRGSGRVGFNDVLVDPDGRVRRGLLFLDEGWGAVEYSFALRVALLDLARREIRPVPAPSDPRWLRLGPTTLPPLGGDAGGYSGEDDAGYQYLLEFPSAPAGFDAIALGSLLRGEVAPERLRDKVVLVGVGAKSLPDFFHVPFRTEEETEVGIAGVALHAYMVDQLIRHGLGELAPRRFLADWQEAGLVALLAVSGAVLGLGVRGSPILGVFALVVIVLLGMAALWLAGAALFRAGWWIPAVAPGVAGLGAVGVVTAWTSSRERAQRAQIMQLFSRHVSAEVADQVWRQRDVFFHDGRPRSQRVVATVLFLDMKGYSSHAEKMDPDRHMEWVNAFMDVMARQVRESGGYVDDYFGDGLKADFGVPLPSRSEQEVAEQARWAVRCALGMSGALEALNERYRETGLPAVAMRIGIDTGPVVAGSIGSAERLKYTVLGDTVVTAERMESLEGVAHDFERHPCRVLVSERTHAHLDDRFESEPLGLFGVKGKEEKVEVYRILGGPR